MLIFLLTFRRTRLLNLNLFEILFEVNEPPIINVCHPLRTFFQERRISSWSFFDTPFRRWLKQSGGFVYHCLSFPAFGGLAALRWWSSPGWFPYPSPNSFTSTWWVDWVCLWYIYVKTLRRLKVRYFTHIPCITIETNQLFTIVLLQKNTQHVSASFVKCWKPPASKQLYKRRSWIHMNGWYRDPLHV